MVDASGITPKSLMAISGSHHTRDVIANISGPVEEDLVGKTVKGTVLSQDKQGNTVLQIDKGTLTFKSPVPLPKGSNLLVHLLAKGNDYQVRILSVNEQPIAQYIRHLKDLPEASKFAFEQELSQANPRGSSVNPSSGHNVAGQSTQQIAQPKDPALIRQVQATLITADSEVFESIANKSPDALQRVVPEALRTELRQRGVERLLGSVERPGTQFVLKLTNFSNPNDKGEVVKTVVPSQTKPGAAPAAKTDTPKTMPQNTTSSQSTSAAPVTESSQAKVQAPPPLLPNAKIPYFQDKPSHAIDPSMPLTLSLKGDRIVMRGVSLGNERENVSVVRTALGTFHMETYIPKGMTMEFEILQMHPGEIAQATTAQATSPGIKNDVMFQLIKYWSVLGKVFDGMQSQGAETKLSFMQALPTADKDLGAKLLKFFDVIHQGGARDWLGNMGAQALADQGRLDLLAALEGDMAAIKHFASEPVTLTADNKWLMILFPLLADDMLYQLRLFIAEDGSAADRGDKQAGTRFMIEFELEQFGAMQLEGYVNELKKQFNLDIRSHHHLPEFMVTEMVAIFEAALVVFDYKGRMQVEVQDVFSESPMRDMVPKGEDDSIVV